jgi:tRNA A-37 threonylcarbamoyl transferase component Bud32
MATETKCPHCGKPVPVTALGGLCPECLIKAGAADTGEFGPGGTIVSNPARPIPRIEEIAPHFPQLEIIECLGRGGMGAVYKARQPRLDRFVALKILSRKRDSNIPDAEFAERFQREARALARLSHPSIVAVFDFGEAGGFPFLLMEYVDGLTLRQLLQTKKLTPEEALTIVPKICEALQFAHEQGIVHRDIKPENILLDKQGRVKIADFGIAKILGAEASGGNLTGAKDVIGTPHYMAPEQVEKPTTVDHRADIYSLGVVFYEMLTGELPLGKFAAPSKKVQVDVRLDEVVLHALEKEPDRRYQHASEVKTDVETIASSSGSRQLEESPSAKSETRNSISQIGGAVGASAILFGILAVAVLLGWQASDRSFSLPAALGVAAAVTVVAIGFGVWLVSTLARLLGRPVKFEAGTARKAQRTGPEKVSGWITTARWIARIFGTLLLVFYGVFILAEGLPPIATQPEGVVLNFVALGLMLAGFTIGWKSDGAAALLIAAGWTLWHISEGRMEWNLFQTPLPVAALHGFCWWATRGKRTGMVATAVIIFGLALGLGRLLVPTSVFLSGTITDGASGQPIADARLGLEQSDSGIIDLANRPNARTDQHGRFRLYVGWYAEGKRLGVFAPGYLTLETNLGPRALGARNVSRDFQLQRVAPVAVASKTPPVVINTVPESGASAVDPTLTELCVTFSKPMRDGSWSWTVWGEEKFPEMTGPPQFLADGKTCVLPVKLLPGKLYATWLNSDYHKDFTDAEGQPAVPYLLIFETRK